MKQWSLPGVLCLLALCFGPCPALRAADPQATPAKAINNRPPITNELFFVERISHRYMIVLKATGSEPYQVAITPPDNRKRGYFVGESSPLFGPERVEGEKRFQFRSFVSKSVPDPRLGDRDVSEMTVLDRLNHKELVLVKDVEQNLGKDEVKFEERHGAEKNITVVSQGGAFRLASDPGTNYQVAEIHEDSAVVFSLKPNGQIDKDRPIVIKKG